MTENGRPDPAGGEGDATTSLARLRYAQIPGYSRLVGRLRWALPAAAFAIIVLVALWPQFKVPEGEFRIGFARFTLDDATDDQMLNPRYTGIDRNDQPYTVTARTAKRQTGNKNVIDLEQPQADITLKDGRWITVRSTAGVYNQQSEILDLAGDVNLYQDEGYEIVTETARLDLRAGTASGTDRVHGHGPTGEIESEGFSVDKTSNTLVFTGTARLIARVGEGR